MLIKAICLHCFRVDPLEWHSPITQSMFLLYWNDGCCICKHGKITSHSNFRIADTDKDPPKDCPFILEHSVNAH
jgi:hypothetical protein